MYGTQALILNGALTQPVKADIPVKVFCWKLGYFKSPLDSVIEFVGTLHVNELFVFLTGDGYLPAGTAVMATQ